MPDVTFTVSGRILDAVLVLSGSFVVGLVVYATEGLGAGLTATFTAMAALSAFLRLFIR